MLQQAAELRFTTDFGQWNACDRFRQLLRRRTVGDGQRQILLRLMRTTFVVKAGECRNDVVEMFLAEEQEVIERFNAQRLNHPFDEGIGIGRSIRRLQNLAASGA